MPEADFKQRASWVYWFKAALVLGLLILKLSYEIKRIKDRELGLRWRELSRRRRVKANWAYPAQG